MLIARPITTLTAWITLEAGAVVAFVFSVFAQMTPNPLGVSPGSAMVVAYAALLTSFFGGVVAVLQVLMTAKNSKVSHELEMLKIVSEHKDFERQREIEIIKLQNENQRNEIIRNNAWIQTMRKKHPDEPFGEMPSYGPEPDVVQKLQTPEYPRNSPPDSFDGSPDSGTRSAQDRFPVEIMKNTAALRDVRDAVNEVSSKLTGDGGSK